MQNRVDIIKLIKRHGLLYNYLSFAPSDRPEQLFKAQNDYSERFCLPNKLYGRDKEVDTLLQAFDRVSKGNLEVMNVAGYSGTGKTSLVGVTHKPIGNGALVVSKACKTMDDHRWNSRIGRDCQG
jgi:hypothetical protein